MNKNKMKSSETTEKQNGANLNGQDALPGSGAAMDKKVDKKFWTLKRILGIGAVVIFVAAIAYGILTTTGGSKLNVDREKITISQVTQGAFQEYIPVIGSLEPLKTVYLDALEGGRVDEIFIEEGSMVDQGDQILKLTNNNLQLSLINREAEMYETINRLREARLGMERYSLELRQNMAEIDYRLTELDRKLTRYEQLHAKNLISQQEYEQVRDEHDYYQKRKQFTVLSFEQDSLMRAVQVDQLENSVDRMERNLDVVRENLENLVVQAPIHGQLTSLNAEIGESISPGERLGQVDEVDAFKVNVPVDEHYLSRVTVGQTGSFTYAGDQFGVEISKVYPEVQNGRFEVDMEFTGDPPSELRRGQTLHINLELAAPSMATLIPRGGFFQTTGGNWIYVVTQGGEMAVRRDIKLGRQNPQYFEVLSGLEPGEKVVTSSFDNFGDVDVLVLK